MNVTMNTEATTASGTPGADASFETLVRRAAQKLRMPIALVNLEDGDRLRVRAAFGLPRGFEWRSDMALSSLALMAATNPIIIPDARLDPRLADHPMVKGRPGFRCYAAAPLTNTQGHHLGTLCVFDTEPRDLETAAWDAFLDVAERISMRLELDQTTLALHESEERQRYAAQLESPLPWTAAADGEPDTGSTASWAALPQASSLAAVREAWSQSIRSGQTLDQEYRLRKEDGGYHWFRMRAAARRGADGQIMRWYGTLEDINDRKLTASALLESQSMLRFALDFGKLRTWELDLASRRLTASDVSVLDFGLQLGTDVSRHDALMAAIHPDDRQRYGREVSRSWSTGQDFDIEYRSVWPDGSIQWVRITGRPTQDEEGQPLRMVGLSLDITEQRYAEEQRQHAEARVVYLAHHDPLTGLANRPLFHQKLAEALEGATSESKVALLRIDLDDFKTINDTMGHEIGDKLLRHAAERLRGCVRQSDVVARYGSDEFAVLLKDVSSAAEVDVLALRLLTSLDEPIEMVSQVVVLGGSIGISMAPDDATWPHQLLRNADTALYRTKTTSRGGYHFFEPAMDTHMQDREMLKLSLRDALSRDEFRLFYQPLIDLKTGAVASFEALIRWQHPTHGLVSPTDFIPIAEETGWIVPIGRWALIEACREAATWPEAVSVAVNLSAVQFRGTALATEVGHALTNSGLAPNRLELEVTETLLLSDDDANTTLLRSLRRMGVRIAMDDFGTGYSSLGYLRRFPFDKIKIDQSLIRELPDADGGDAIVQAIIGLGQILGISITAEGVETRAQLDLLRRMGCTQVQGYFFSPPVPAPLVQALLNKHFDCGTEESDVWSADNAALIRPTPSADLSSR
jgi:diguanylate cyclase (GGDEF)-like protein